MNTKAIAVYLDDNDRMEIELSWLYKTWLLHKLDEEYDLVIYYNPTAINRLKNFPNTINIAMSYIRMSSEYKFLNSHYFCMKEYNQPLQKYKYLLKTDCDVFLTQNLKNYTPSKFLVGQGGYYHPADSEKVEYIRKLSKEFGLGYNNMSRIGASFYGKTSSVLAITSFQAEITEKLLINKFKDQQQVVRFDRGIASMIAGELVINHAFCNQNVNLYCLDNNCWDSTVFGSDILHIHAWHSDIPWSKHAFFENKYKDWIVTYDQAYDNTANYCHWIATTSLEDIKKYREDV